MNDKTQREFEDWAINERFMLDRPAGAVEYRESSTQIAWYAWQHQRAIIDAKDAEIARLQLIAGSHEHMQELLHLEQDENMRLRALLNTPHTADWFEGVRLEAAHQINRWGAEHDAGKTAADWFWLVGYLAGKALTSAIICDIEKAKHHTISTAAVLLNWHRAITGESNAMRPGIEPPKEN